MVIIETRGHSETRTQRRAQHAGPCGRADESELRQIQAQTARLRTLVDDDIEPVILHRRIKIFFDGRLQTMDLVDEQERPLFPKS